MPPSSRPIVLVATLACSACGYDTSTTTSAIEQPILGYAVPIYRSTPSWDWNRCVVDPIGQVEKLKQRGDIIGTHIGVSPDPSEEYDHWQGVARLAVDTTHHFVLDVRKDDGARFEVALIGRARDHDGLRLRGNRMDPSKPDWDAAPLFIDTIWHDQKITTDHQHPGGMQTLGSFVAVPLESSQNGDRAQISFWDMSALSETANCSPACDPVNLGSFPVSTEWASVAGIAKLANGYQSDGGYLLTTANQDSEVFEFYISEKGIPLSAIPFDAAAVGMLDRSTVQGFRSYYQHVSLITECPAEMGEEYPPEGAIYLLGTVNDDGEDYVDLFKLDIVEGEDPNWPGTKYTVAAKQVASRHLYCSSASYPRQCNFNASAGTYIDPSGRLMIYAAEHDNDGPSGSVKMMEFRSVDHLDDPSTTSLVEGCPSVRDAFIELYDDALDGTVGDTSAVPGAQRSYIDECADLHARSHNFENAYDFEDKTLAIRYCIPTGYAYRLFIDKDFQGADAIVPGDWTFAVTAGVPSEGQIKGFNWSHTAKWSSGCWVRSDEPDICISECL